MWTEITRGKYAQKGLRHASDLTDLEWVVIVPLATVEQRRSRPRRTNLREVANALFYISRGGEAFSLERKRWNTSCMCFRTSTIFAFQGPGLSDSPASI